MYCLTFSLSALAFHLTATPPPLVLTATPEGGEGASLAEAAGVFVEPAPPLELVPFAFLTVSEPAPFSDPAAPELIPPPALGPGVKIPFSSGVRNNVSKPVPSVNAALLGTDSFPATSTAVT